RTFHVHVVVALTVRSVVALAEAVDLTEGTLVLVEGPDSPLFALEMKVVVCYGKVADGRIRKEAVTYIERGHVRVGRETVVDPAFHVTVNMQDFVTWVDSSSFRRKVLQYHQKLDDYDVMT
ncbi:hypothetical protein Dimus_036415, partial [Dionaea muscipula]